MLMIPEARGGEVSREMSGRIRGENAKLPSSWKMWIGSLIALETQLFLLIWKAISDDLQEVKNKIFKGNQIYHHNTQLTYHYLKLSVLAHNEHYFLSQRNTCQCTEGKGKTLNHAFLCPGWNCFSPAPLLFWFISEIMWAISPWQWEAFSVVICLGSPDSRQWFQSTWAYLPAPGTDSRGAHVVMTWFILRTRKRCLTFESFSTMMNEMTHLFQYCQKRVILLLHPNHLF